MRGDPHGRRRPKLTRALLKGVDPSKSPNGPVYFQQLQLAAKRGLLPECAWEAIVASYQSQYLIAARLVRGTRRRAAGRAIVRLDFT